MNIKLAAAAFLALFALAGCSNTPAPVGGAPGLEVVSGDLPAPTDADIYGSDVTPPVRVGDTIRIDVFGVEDLSDRQLSVGPDGTVSFPLIGRIQVAGLQPAQVSERIEQRLRGGFIRNPQVSTVVTETSALQVTVYGAVKVPGVYPIRNRSSLLTTVATAQGLGEFADSRDVVVFRTVSGQRMATLYNLEAISRGMYDDPAIYPNDIVVVGQSESRRLFDDLVGAATLVATPLTILLQNVI